MKRSRDIWFTSTNGAQWRPASARGWWVLGGVLGSDLLVVALCCWAIVVTGNMAWIAPMLLMGPVTIGVFFYLVSRHGEIIPDKK